MFGSGPAFREKAPPGHTAHTSGKHADAFAHVERVQWPTGSGHNRLGRVWWFPTGLGPQTHRGNFRHSVKRDALSRCLLQAAQSEESVADGGNEELRGIYFSLIIRVLFFTVDTLR